MELWIRRAAMIRSPAARSVSAPTTNQTTSAKRPARTVSAGQASARNGRKGRTRTPLANNGRTTSASSSAMARASAPPAQATAWARASAAPAMAAISESACQADGSRATRIGPAGPATTSSPPRVHQRARPATTPAARARARALDRRSVMRAAGSSRPTGYPPSPSASARQARLRRGYGAAGLPSPSASARQAREPLRAPARVRRRRAPSAANSSRTRQRPARAGP